MDIKKVLIITLLLILITGCAETSSFNIPGLKTKEAKQGIGVNIAFKEGQPRTDRISQTAGFKVTPILKNNIPEEIFANVCIRDTWDASKVGIEPIWDCQNVNLEPATTQEDEKTKEKKVRAPSEYEAEYERYFYEGLVEESNQYSTDIIARVTYSIDIELTPKFEVPKGSSKFSVSGNDLGTSTKYLPVTISSIDVFSTTDDDGAELDLVINIKNQGGGAVTGMFEEEKDKITISTFSETSELTCPDQEPIKLVDGKAEIDCIAFIEEGVFPTNTGLDILLSYTYQIETQIKDIPIIA